MTRSYNSKLKMTPNISSLRGYKYFPISSVLNTFDSVILNIHCFFFQGFITMAQFRSIVAEVDPNLTEEDLDGIIAEIDEDGSGTMDFDEFCEMMMSTAEEE